MIPFETTGIDRLLNGNRLLLLQHRSEVQWQPMYTVQSTQQCSYRPQWRLLSRSVSNRHEILCIVLKVVDIFLVCDEGSTGSKYFQIWVNNKDNGFVLAHLGRLPQGTQSISFADMGAPFSSFLILA